MTFTIFDITILTIITVSSILGLYRGFVNIIIGLIGFIASIIVAILLYPYFKTFLLSYITSELIVSIGAGVSAYIASFLVFAFLVSKIIFLFSGYSCGLFDRFLGLVAGVIRGVLFSLIIFITISIFSTGSYLESKNAEELLCSLSSDKYPEWLQNSKLTKILENATKNIILMLPEDMLKNIELPNYESKSDDDENLIDSIKRTKEDDEDSLIDSLLDEDLENSIKELSE